MVDIRTRVGSPSVNYKTSLQAQSLTSDFISCHMSLDHDRRMKIDRYPTHDPTHASTPQWRSIAAGQNLSGRAWQGRSAASSVAAEASLLVVVVGCTFRDSRTSR